MEEKGKKGNGGKFVKKGMAFLLSFAVAAVLLAGAQRLVMPKYASDVLEGNFTSEYYEETTGHDVIFIGDCEVYENIDPIYMWSNYGIASYIRGNAQQLAWQSYYMLEDTLKYETPRVVVYNVQALVHAEPQREEYNRMTLDGMRWSATKVDAIRASMCEGEELLDYVFPILRYHGRILELGKDDFTYFWNRRKISHNGYYMRIDVLPVSESDVADTEWLLGDDGAAGASDGESEEIDDPWDDIDIVDEDEPQEAKGAATDTKEGEPFGNLPMKYLDKIRTLCENEGVQLVLMKAPSLAPQWYDSDNQQVVEYADRYGLPYINFYELLDETGIDYETDTYDGGLHMNLGGADKLSKYLGRVLSTTYQIPDRREEPEYAAAYQEKVGFYQDMIAAQKKELEQYGEIRSY